MKKILICTLLCALAAGTGASAETIDSLREDMYDGKLMISGSGLNENDKIVVEIFDLSGQSAESEAVIDFAGVFETDDSGSYNISFYIPDTAESGEKEVFVKPVLSPLQSGRLKYYKSKDVLNIVDTWNDAIENQSSSKMEELINSATAVEILLNTDISEALVSGLSGSGKTVLTSELLKLSTAEGIADFAEDFKKLYINFAINNLPDGTCAELLDRFYDEVDTVKGDIYSDIIVTLDKQKLFLDAAGAREKGNSMTNAEFTDLIYNRAVLMKFKEISYYTEIHPYMEKYNDDYFKIDFTGYNNLKNKYPVDSGILEQKESYKSFSELSDIFKGLVSKEAAAEEDTNRGGSSGGSGGSGGSSGKSSSNLNLSTGVSVVQPVHETVFDDLENYGWAEEHILTLYNAGVVDGMGNKTFAPGAHVTREQFVKMISALIIMPESTEKSGFTDVREGEWYEKYLDAAKQTGLVSGRDDGSFGIGEQITRQDAAVMCVNALKIAKPELIDGLVIEKPSFKDAEDISSYAVYAVSVLEELKILNGDNDGRFNPGKGASRAEAAVMISRVLGLVK